jgi:hypothetical protein
MGQTVMLGLFTDVPYHPELYDYMTYTRFRCLRCFGQQGSQQQGLEIPGAFEYVFHRCTETNDPAQPIYYQPQYQFRHQIRFTYNKSNVDRSLEVVLRT